MFYGCSVAIWLQDCLPKGSLTSWADPFFIYNSVPGPCGSHNFLGLQDPDP
jgi:hypothetical protein